MRSVGVEPNQYDMTRVERVCIVVTVVAPFVALCIAIATLWGGAVTALDLSAFLIG